MMKQEEKELAPGPAKKEMLTEDDKQRIRDEEIFRAEVRRELEAAQGSDTRLRKRLIKFVQSPLGIWFLSSVVLGLITWTYAERQSRVQATRQKSELVRRLDGEARSRIQQWLNMCEVRWIKNTFVGPEFHKWYFELVKTPTKNPQYMYVIHPVYAEFADQSLVSILTQLRDNVPVSERQPIERAVTWVGTWNPDVWENKSFDEQVKLARANLQIDRWK